ncbi:DUF6923 family protein [Streptomyces sp. NPDC094448]|uniref:DUF6923 family protein n=1 Tax=Streptomyces sp. NPDC094448 TaxID=3366063 RepID=UPI00380873CB
MPRKLWSRVVGATVALTVCALAPPAQALSTAPAEKSGSAPRAVAPASGQSAAGARARAPFSCAGDILLAAGDTTTQLYEGVTGPGEISFMPVGSATVQYNAMGVNPDDEYVYAIQRGGTPNLLRIDDAGAVTTLGSVGLPAVASNYASGAFDDAGNYYVASGYDNRLYRVDITAMTSTLITLGQTLNGVIDFAYSNGYLWGADLDGAVVRIDPATGTVTSYPGVLPNPDPGDGYGGAFTYGNGDLGFFRNSGTIYRVQLSDPATPVFSILSSQAAPAMSIAVDATSCFQAPVDLAVAKTGPATVSAGGQVSYTITVTNNGPNPSSGWTLTDTVPAGLTGAATTTNGCSVANGTLSCTGGALAVGASTEITLTGTAAVGTTSIENTATVFGNDPDPDPGNNEDTTTTTVSPSVDLAVAKTGPAEATAGGEVAYTITVTNNGPSPSTGWTVTDTIPADLLAAATTTPGCAIAGNILTCTGGALAVGDSATISLTGTAATGADRIVNTAVVDGNEPDPDPGNNKDTTTTGLGRRVDLAVAKTGPATVTEGDPVAYTITVTNNGPSDSTGWGLDDPIPAGLADAATTTPGCSIDGGDLICIGGPLAVGDSTEISLTGTAATGADRIVNTAVVEGNDPDPDPGNNEDTTTTTVTPRPEPEVDLAVGKTGPASVDPGGRISYTITVTNNGPDASSGWTLSDPIPAQILDPATDSPGCGITAGRLTCDGGALAVGDSVTVTVSGTVAADATGDIVNTATVDGEEPDPDPGNNEDTTTTTVNATPGLTLTKKQNGPATVAAGQGVEYTITVTNTGTTTYTEAAPASFTDDLSELLDDARYNGDAEANRGTVVYDEPVLSWSGALAPGESATITFSITTNARPFGDLKLLNTVVSDTPGSNCPAGGDDTRCTTKGKVDARDKDKGAAPAA